MSESTKKRIGMMVAVEIDAVFGKYGDPLKTYDSFGFKVYEYELAGARVFVIHSGAGEIAAAAATQLLITAYGAELIVNFGVVGGLTEDMKLARTVVPERVVHYDFDTSPVDGTEPGKYIQYPDRYIPISPELVKKALEVEPSLVKVTCASGDKFIDAPEEKRRLARDFGAHICEMELAAVAITCDRCGVPCIALKTVSDSIEGGAEEFSRSLAASSEVCLKITEKLIESL